MHALRPYQNAAVEAVWGAYKAGYKAPLVVAPTGSGKSHIIAEVCRRVWTHTDYWTLVLTHRRELVSQNATKIRLAVPDANIGIYAASFGRKETARITVGQIQSFTRLKNAKPFRLVIIDEAHLVPFAGFGQYRTALAALAELDPDMRLLGLTATDYRLGGGRLHEGDGAIFDTVAHTIDIPSLIEQGHLVEPVPFNSGMNIGLQRVKKSAGEFQIGAQDTVIDQKYWEIARKIKHYAKLNNRQSVIVFCPGVKAVNSIASGLRYKCAGDPDAAVGEVIGTTTDTDREKMIAEFRAGKIQYLVNCDVLTTGFDAPETDMVVLLRATASPGLYVQMVGRGMRPAPGKADCLVIDFGENATRHGPLDDVAPPAKGREKPPSKLKECPGCHRLVPVAVSVCPGCGAEFPAPKPVAREVKSTSANAGALLTGQAFETRVMDCEYRWGQGKDGKPDHVRAIYTVNGTIDPVSEFFCPEHEGLAGDIWRRRRKELGSDADTVAECAQEFDRWPVPVRVSIAPHGKYWRVRKAIYSE